MKRKEADGSLFSFMLVIFTFGKDSCAASVSLSIKIKSIFFVVVKIFNLETSFWKKKIIKQREIVCAYLL